MVTQLIFDVAYSLASHGSRDLAFIFARLAAATR
jgi:hypothetical protein